MILSGEIGNRFCETVGCQGTARDDYRIPGVRWNIFYLIKLKKLLNKFNFSHVYDLQNSSRTSFYRKYLLNISNWSSTETILKKGEKRKDFINEFTILADAYF